MFRLTVALYITCIFVVGNMELAECRSKVHASYIRKSNTEENLRMGENWGMKFCSWNKKRSLKRIQSYETSKQESKIK